MTTTAATQATTILGEWLALLDKEGISERNRDAHRMGIERFAEYLKPRGPDEATAADVRGFLSYLGELGVSEQSRGVYRLILDKWVAFAMDARRRNATAEAAARALAGLLPPEPVSADPEDSTLVIDIGGVEAAPVVEDADSLSESQAESTWPFGRPRPVAAVPAGPLAAAFDGASSTEAPVAAVTIDFAPVDVAPVTFDDAPAFPSASPFGTPPSPTFDAESRSAASPFDVAPTPFEPAAPVAVEEPSAPAAAFETTTFAPPPSLAPPPAFGGFTFENPQAPQSFGSGSTFGSPSPASDSETTFMSPEPGKDPDATPVKPLAPASPTPPSIMTRSAPPARDAATGDHLMGEGVASIPLAMGGAAARKSDAKAAPSHEPHAAELKAAVQGWGLRMNGTERNDLDLTQIRNLVATGVLPPQALIRKPGGEWMKAGEYQPLRSVFQQAQLDASQGGPRPSQKAMRDPLAHPAAMAWLGASLGAVVGAAAWWLVAVIAGSEVLPMALVVGALSGGLASWIGRGESLSAVGASAVSTILAMVVGRAAVYQTLKAGVIGGPSTEVADPFVFLASSATAASLTWWGIGIAMAAGVGGLALLLRRR